MYVGRALERPLGKRLFEHTFDRLNGRSNRFSWFGFFKASDEGNLIASNLKTMTSNANDIVVSMEALLIEGLEPKQNRKRGDKALAAVEYIQTEDQVPKKEKLLAQIIAALKSRP